MKSKLLTRLREIVAPTPASGRESESDMEIDYEKLGAAVAKSLKPSFDEQASNLNIIANTLAKAPSTPAAAVTVNSPAKPAGESAQPLTLEGVAKLVKDTVSSELTTFQKNATVGQQREAFIGQHMSKLPATYRNQLGNDPAKWESEAKTIQASFEADFKGLGGKPETIGGATTTDGGKVVAKETVDLSKLSPIELIAMGNDEEPNNSATPKK